MPGRPIVYFTLSSYMLPIRGNAKVIYAVHRLYFIKRISCTVSRLFKAGLALVVLFKLHLHTG